MNCNYETTIFLCIAIPIAIFLALREFNCWYWKMNERNELLRRNNQLLSAILLKMGGEVPKEEIENPKPVFIAPEKQIDEEKEWLKKTFGTTNP